MKQFHLILTAMLAACEAKPSEETLLNKSALDALDAKTYDLSTVQSQGTPYEIICSFDNTITKIKQLDNQRNTLLIARSASAHKLLYSQISTEGHGFTGIITLPELTPVISTDWLNPELAPNGNDFIIGELMYEGQMLRLYLAPVEQP